MSSYLGQNFLTDSAVLSRIADEVKTRFLNLGCENLIEIGPGKGALTKRILGITPHNLLIEYDEKMVSHLHKTSWILPPSSSKGQIISKPFTLIHQDILQRDDTETDFFDMGGQDRQKSTTLVAGNLPYYITSPILRKFFGYTKRIRAGGVFLIQKEVAEKIVHDAPKKSFLRWLINYAYCVEYCFSVPPSAFTPPPKVTSAVIRVIPKSPDEIPSLSYDDLLIFLDQYSPFKRKTLGASSKIVEKLRVKSDQLRSKSFDISPYSHQRLEELGWKEMEGIIKTGKALRHENII